jgi:hypothetical protein
MYIASKLAMSKQRKTSTVGSTASGKGFTKKTTGSKQKSVNAQQESTASVAAVPPVVPSSEQQSTNVTFTAAMLHLQVATLDEVITEGTKQIEHYASQINELTPEVGQEISINNSTKIIEYINLLIHIKELVARLLAWMSVIASIAHYFVLTFNEQLPDNLIFGIEEGLTNISHAFDVALTSVPSGSILGITLAPDQKQVSETKAIISDVFSRLDKITQENEVASQDWGAVEQNAYERILEGSAKNVSGEEFLNWLSELEQGGDV